MPRIREFTSQHKAKMSPMNYLSTVLDCADMFEPVTVLIVLYFLCHYFLPLWETAKTSISSTMKLY